MIPLLSKNRLNKKYVYCLRIQSIWYTDKVMITQNSKFTCGRGKKEAMKRKGPKRASKLSCAMDILLFYKCKD